METNMKNLPKQLTEDRDNAVYWDSERERYYMIEWNDAGRGDKPIRHYIPKRHG